jgi:protein-disulfide isomerase
MNAQLSDPVSAGDHLRGRLDAPMQLVVYGDYECPYTRRALIQVRAVHGELGDDFVLVYRNFPLVEVHPHALGAAQAAEAAARQDKFWEMHDSLFEHQRALADADLTTYARQVGLDESRFEADRGSALVRSRIDADLRRGKSSGVGGTPTLFVSGQFYSGSYDARPLIEALKSSLSRDEQ